MTMTTTLNKKKKATTANDKNMTRTHAVSVEGVDFSGVFLELWRKGETELSTQESFRPTNNLLLTNILWSHEAQNKYQTL